MGVFEYKDVVLDLARVELGVRREQCLYCKTAMNVLKNGTTPLGYGGGHETTIVRCCPDCGWWNALYSNWAAEGGEIFSITEGATGALRNLCAADASEPLSELKQNLTKRYN